MPKAGVRVGSIPKQEESNKEHTLQKDIDNGTEFLARLIKDEDRRKNVCKSLGLAPDALSVRLLYGLHEVLIGSRDDKLVEECYTGENAKDYSSLRNEPHLSPGLLINNLSTARSGPPQWFWQNRLPKGGLSMIYGDPGSGKTYFLLDTASKITRGFDFVDADNPWKKFPSDKRPRKVYWIGQEDSDQIIKYRIEQLGGDPSMIEIGSKVMQDDKKIRFLNLRTDIQLLKNYLVANPLIELVCVDPVTAFLGRTDPNKNNEVRNALAPLNDMLDQVQVTAIGISHFNKMEEKKTIYRAMGSIAFVAGPRSSWVITRDTKDKEKRLFLEMKNSYAQSQAGLSFRIDDTGVVWGKEKVNISTDEAVSDNDIPVSSALQDAIDWLKEILAPGEMFAANVWKLVEDNGFCKNTVQKASKRLNVRKWREGGSSGFMTWALPHE